MVFGIVALGLLNGLLFLPVYLSCKSSTGYIILYTALTKFIQNCLKLQRRFD